MWIIIFISSVWKLRYKQLQNLTWLLSSVVIQLDSVQLQICQLYTIQLKSSSTKNSNLHPARFSLFCSHCVSAIISFDSSTSWTLNWYVLTKMLFWPCPVFQYDSGPGGAELHICSDGYREQTALRFLPAFIGSSQLPLHPQVQTAGFKSTSLIWTLAHFRYPPASDQLNLIVVKLSLFSYLPWFEVFYKLLNILADYTTKGQVSGAHTTTLIWLGLIHDADVHIHIQLAA